MQLQTPITKQSKTKQDAARRQAETPEQPRARSHSSSSKGTPSSNTVPSNSISQCNTKILRSGIDSLYLSYKGDLFVESSIKLTELKKLAQSCDPRNVALAQYKKIGHIFDVSDKGSNPFAYVLKDNWYRISISKLGNTKTPLAYAQVSSELLTLEGVEIASTNLSSIIKSLGNVSGSANVSRVDLCVDFITDYPLDQITESDWITKAKDMSRYIDQRQFSGWKIGTRKTISARLYNKTLEMKKNPRPYLEQLWKKSGWDGIQSVWRLEFELRRDFLRAFSVVSIESMNQHLSGLWQYATCDWLRLAIPNPSDKTQSRWLTSDLWQTLQSVTWTGKSELLRTPVHKGRPPSDRSLFVNGLSGYTSFMAREGIVNPSEGAHKFFLAARKYHDGREHYTSLFYDDYVEQKVALKVKSYNSGINQSVDSDIHPAEKAVIDAYREQSDGK